MVVALNEGTRVPWVIPAYRIPFSTPADSVQMILKPSVP